MAFQKGQSGNPAGRKLGAVNKFTSLKNAFLEAFELIGGTAALAEWAKKSERNRGVFYGLTTKLFPQEVAHSGAIKTGDKLTIHVVHTKAEDMNKTEYKPGAIKIDGNGGEKKA